MACSLQRSDVERIVLHVIQAFVRDDQTSLATSFADDLRLASSTLQTFFVPIDLALHHNGCGLRALSPLSFEKASTPGDLVDMIVSDLSNVAATSKPQTITERQ